MHYGDSSGSSESSYLHAMPTGATIIVSVGFGGLSIIIGIALVFYCKTCMARMSKTKITPAAAPTV